METVKIVKVNKTMKLYATIQSERATKGQGGNEFLEILIKADGLEDIPTRTDLYEIRLEVKDGRLYATLHDYSSGIDQDLITFRGQPKDQQSFLQPLQDYEKDDILPKEKGEKEKDEHTHRYFNEGTGVRCEICNLFVDNRKVVDEKGFMIA
jgi:hypothetical protein